MIMAARKKVQPKVDVNLIPREESEENVKNAYEKGKQEGQLEGQQEVYRAIADFLSNRMLTHFQVKNDELAKELREIYSLIKANIK